ncbi:MAG: hypothetical protein MZV63_69445 [Marinilabiliales bacterium]|nr:hypothetical protein [Marinilabiliales bacterium]
MNERQKKLLNKILDGFEGKLTSSKWAKIAKCSKDTAIRDINDLISKDILKKDEAGGRSTNYVLITRWNIYCRAAAVPEQDFTGISASIPILKPDAGRGIESQR